MAVEEAFLRQPEWAARERKAPTGPEGKGELETRRKWPKSRVSAGKGGLGQKRGGGGDVKWAKGEGERRESERESMILAWRNKKKRKKKKGRKAGAAGGQKEACCTEARDILFTPGAAQGSLVAGWRGPPRGVLARPEGASAARCRPAPGHAASCRNLRHCIGGFEPVATAERA